MCLHLEVLDSALRAGCFNLEDMGELEQVHLDALELALRADGLLDELQ